LLCVTSGILDRLLYAYGFFNLFLLLLLIVIQWLLITSAAKRWHDAGRSGALGVIGLFGLWVPFRALDVMEFPVYATQYRTTPLAQTGMLQNWVSFPQWVLVTSGAERWPDLLRAEPFDLLVLFLLPQVLPALFRPDAGPNQYGANPRNQKAPALFWISFSGRMKRCAYALRMAASFLLVQCIYVSAVAVDYLWGRKIALGFGNGISGGSITPVIDGFSAFADFALFLACLATLIVFVAAGARRWHDLGMNGIFAPLNFLLAPAIVLAFLRGTKGRNEYGPDPARP